MRQISNSSNWKQNLVLINNTWVETILVIPTVVKNKNLPYFRKNNSKIIVPRKIEIKSSKQFASNHSTLTPHKIKSSSFCVAAKFKKPLEISHPPKRPPTPDFFNLSEIESQASVIRKVKHHNQHQNHQISDLHLNPTCKIVRKSSQNRTTQTNKDYSLKVCERPYRVVNLYKKPSFSKTTQTEPHRTINLWRIDPNIKINSIRFHQRR